MNVLIVGRTLPTDKNGSHGLFEFEQAKALSKLHKTGYLFLENSSILSNRKIKSINTYYNEVPTVGTYLPIKGIPKIIYENIKTKLFVKKFNEFVNSFWMPDIVHIHFPLLTINYQIIRFLKENKIKIVVTEHWSKVQNKQLSSSQIKLLNHICINSNQFICVSDSLRKSVVDLTNIDDDKIIVVPNMVSELFFRVNNNHQNSNKNFVFTYIGNLTPGKRVDLLISAFEKAFKFDDTVKLLIIGDGPLRGKLEKKVRQDSKKIQFLGNRSRRDIVNYLYQTSIYVSASSLETFGVPFIEALSLGVPVIGANNLPIKNYINEDNGILFEVDNEKDLINKLKYMYKEKSKFNIEKIKKDSKNNFSPTAVCNSLTNIYSKIV